ncbi:MAG: copper chaperone PCu(A)C [Arenimonas sp.]|nr:copper chaperone PCu(A)C [Arenimonas sp.]
MKAKLFTTFALLFLLSLNSVLANSTMQFSNAWIRATPPNAQVAGGFVEINNQGNDDRLLSISSALSSKVEIHEMQMQGDVMQMRQLKDGLQIPGKEITTLKPGGMHLMFIKPKQALTEGQKISATFFFAKAGKREVVFTVRKNAPE